LLYYEGTLWYTKSFDYTFKNKNNKIFLYFGAANYEAEVYLLSVLRLYLNGKKLGVHVGDLLLLILKFLFFKEKNNFLIIKVGNKRLKEGIPTPKTDWWNYGA